MTINEFDQLTLSIWSPYLQRDMGFSFKEGAFFREMEDGTRHVILLDFDTRKAKTFRIIIGFNSSIISQNASPVEAGVFGVRYLGETELSSVPKNFPCFNQEHAKASLMKTLLMVRDVVTPWFEKHKTVQEIAELVEESHPFIKGMLLFHSDKREEARHYFLQHTQYLQSQPQTEAIVQGLRATEEILKKCI